MSGAMYNFVAAIEGRWSIAGIMSRFETISRKENPVNNSKQRANPGVGMP